MKNSGKNKKKTNREKQIKEKKEQIKGERNVL